MTREPLEKPMDIDSPKQNKEIVHKNGLELYPVSTNSSGEGLPYAPENWPNPGDKWRWKVGKRIAPSGYFMDRYVYVPSHVCRAGFSKRYASKLSLKQFIRENYPDVNIDAFFSSFSWKVPAQQVRKDDLEALIPPVGSALKPESDDQNGEVHCKAGNRLCSSLNAGKMFVSDIMFCDICCGEPVFCRDCCCILCCGKVDKKCGEYSYIRCDANSDGYVCGHISHIECALRAYMAGTVGGSIGLDAEYYCRRCDSRTDLVSHVTKILHTCESIDSSEEIQKILKVCKNILRGSKKTRAKELLHQIELTMRKLKNGGNLDDIWKKEDFSASIAGLSSDANGEIKSPSYDEPRHCEIALPQLSSRFDHRVESIKLEDEIDHILDELKKSQEMEYHLACEKLSAQKGYILNLYQQLEKERTNFTKSSSKDMDSLLDAVLNRVDQIKREVTKLRDMAEVAKGFGRVPKHILKEHFGIN